jgi:hypothetical protein
MRDVGFTLLNQFSRSPLPTGATRFSRPEHKERNGMKPETNDPEAAAEVLAVLQAESEAFWRKDFDAFSQCWAAEAYVRRAGWWQRGGITWRRGWTTIADIARQQFGANPEVNASAQAVRRENVTVRVGADMAWVTFDQYAPDAGEADMDMPGLSHETRILEKRGGRWVIVYVGYLLVGA